jgi:hypothetical protein|eukprot:Stramenopile-MAST_4_protein_4134
MAPHMLQLSLLFLLMSVLFSTCNWVVEAEYPQMPSPKKCRPYTCKIKTHKPVPATLTNVTSLGCNSGGVALFSTKDGLELKKCCDMRQACFKLCGASYIFCENQFSVCADAQCAKLKNPEKMKSCKMNSNLMLMAATIAGCNDFRREQRLNCVCVISDYVLETKQKKLLKKFYRVHNRGRSKNEKKIAALVKKHGKQPNTFAELGYRLIGKYYPASIQMLHDPTEEELVSEDDLDQSHRVEVGAQGTVYDDGDVIDLDAD